MCVCIHRLDFWGAMSEGNVIIIMHNNIIPDLNPVSSYGWDNKRENPDWN